jgi:hypothetical protein
MRQHTNLPAMVRFMSHHVAQHFHTVQCARSSCGGTFKCGAVSRTHFKRILCMCVKIAAIVRALPGGFAVHAAGSSCSIRIWFIRSFAAKVRTAARPRSV